MTATTSPAPGPLPPLDELLEGMRVVRLPMAVRFRGIVTREAALLRGPNGWAEFSPFLEYDPEEASRWLAAAIEYGWSPRLPGPVREAVPVNATMPAVPAERVPEVLARYGPGIDTVKVKVAGEGQALADDAARVAAVREAMPDAAIRVDANGRWGEDEAVRALTALARFDLEYAEQPVATVEGLARVRRRMDGAVRIAADESIRKAEDPLRVAELGAADVIVLKAQPLGGVARALEVAREAGLPTVVSSALDTPVGLAAGALLAASLPDLPFACGLGTASLFADDVADDPVQDGTIRPTRVAPDAAALARLAAPVDREGWWRARVAACRAVLAGAAPATRS